MIFKKTEQYVTDVFAELHHPNLVYHNLQHTRNVVNKASEIAAHYNLSERDMLVVFLAAWFHDTGQLNGPYKNHEKRSVEFFKEFAEKENLPADVVEDVIGCILSTEMPRNPKNLLQQVLCDADMYHLGTKDFKESNDLVYNEIHNLKSDAPSRQEFLVNTLDFMKTHTFYTSYAVDKLEGEKQKNMKKLKKKLEGQDKKHEKKENGALQMSSTEEKPLEITEKAGTTKGMQTMLRLTSQNQMQLSEMADNKANILISVNAIIISVILSVLLRKLQTDPYLTVPTLIFLLAAVSTMVISILATRPKLNIGTFSEDDIVHKRTNLLFFGNFHKMPLADYEHAMRTMMNDPDYLYSSIVQDNYHLGVVLGKKYKLIRLAYNVFMIGIIISVLAFAIASFQNSSTETTTTTPTNTTTTNTNSNGSPF